MADTLLSPSDQLAGLSVIGYLEDLFTSSPRESFTTIEILSILNTVKNDPELFEPDCVAAYDKISAEIEAKERDEP